MILFMLEVVAKTIAIIMVGVMLFVGAAYAQETRTFNPEEAVTVTVSAFVDNSATVDEDGVVASEIEPVQVIEVDGAILVEY